VEYQSHLFLSGQRIEQLRAAVEANPEDPSALNNLAWELVLDPEAEEYDPQEATELALRGVGLAPANTYLWNTLGLALVRSQRWDEAVEALEKSIALDSGKGGAEDWYFLAMAWHGKGDLTRARECHERARGFEESEELEPWDREVRALLGLDAKD
jgi:tetratricopeptide (TPR) repeat protein